MYRELYETQFRQVIEHEQMPGTGEPEGPTLDIAALGTSYDVRRITEADISDVFLLTRSNRRYFRSLGERPTMGSLTAIISDVPEGAGPNNKYFVGFYDEEGDLVAVLELICGYPTPTAAFIGWFMVDASMQGQGVGSSIFADVRAALSAQGYDHVVLRLPERATQGITFWETQGFTLTGERDEGGRYPIVTLARDI